MFKNSLNYLCLKRKGNHYMKASFAFRAPLLILISALFIQSCSSDIKTQSLAAKLGSSETSMPDVVRVKSGLLKGTESENVIAYLGIPYAKAPVNQLRWMPPQPYTKWDGIKDASHFANDCMQLPFPGDSAPLGEPVSEDCLYLNIWKAKNVKAKKLPVMVWVHGGGFVNGGASPAIYNGKAFAKSGVIFVSFNYRLGRFGFFAHPALTAESGSRALGNYGFMDQIAALKWVQENIAQFGGDPKNVTLFGESAGGRSVNALMISPKAKGLFQKAIVQSGGGRSSSISPLMYLNKKVQKALTSKDEHNKFAEDYGIAFAQRFNIEGTDKAALEKLRAIPAEQVVDGLNMGSMSNVVTYSGPMIDGTVVIENDDEGFSKGHQMKIPYIVGANEFEWGFLSDFAPQAAKAIAMKTLAKSGQRKKAFMAAYQPHLNRGTANNKSIDLGVLGSMLRGDIGFVEPSRFIARQVEAAGQPVWLYRFNYIPTQLVGKAKGAYHATEIPFVFDTGVKRYKEEFSQNDEKVANIMHNYWVNFAKKGKPEGPRLPVWPMYNKGEEQVIEFNINGAEAKKDPLFDRLNELELTL